MHTAIPLHVSCKRAPWNKGRLIGQKRPLKPKDAWAIRVRLSCRVGNEISLCSTSRSTASSEAAISFACRSTTYAWMTAKVHEVSDHRTAGY
jgi:hypothetical protein